MKAWVLLLLIVLSSHHVFAQDSINADSVRQITLKHIVANDSLDKVLPMVSNLKSKKIKSKRIVYYNNIDKKSFVSFPSFVDSMSFPKETNFSKSNLILTNSEDKKLTFEDVSVWVFAPITIEESIYVTTRIDYDGLNWFVLFKYDFSLKLLSIKYFSGVF